MPVPNTHKLHCIKPDGSKKLSASTVSIGETFNVIHILANLGNEEIAGDENDANEKEFSAGEWVLVRYDNTNFPGEIIQIVNEEFEVNVMHKSGTFWKWPQKEDNIFYSRKNIVKQLDPPQVAGSHGQFEFKDM